MSPRTGRPPSDNPRTKVRSVHLTVDELLVLENAAEAAGLKLTEYIRDRALRAAKRHR